VFELLSDLMRPDHRWEFDLLSRRVIPFRVEADASEAARLEVALFHNLVAHFDGPLHLLDGFHSTPPVCIPRVKIRDPMLLGLQPERDVSGFLDKTVEPPPESLRIGVREEYLLPQRIYVC